VPDQELRVLLGEDVIGDDRELAVVAEQAAEPEQQGGLAAADRTPDPDGERPGRVVAAEGRPAIVEDPGPDRVVVMVFFGVMMKGWARHR
jgi:hypothetical protein